MEKWADYGLSKVQYDGEGKLIVQVEVREDKGKTIGTPKTWSRDRLVSAISNGRSFVTLVRSRKGFFRRGKEIHVATVGGTPYVRTDRHHRASDVLKDLPELAQ
jgi:hypothetical protein